MQPPSPNVIRMFTNFIFPINLPVMSFRGSAATVGISRYNVCNCIADRCVVPGDCHGPNGPRNDMVGYTVR